MNIKRFYLVFTCILLVFFSGCSSKDGELNTTGTIEAEEVRITTEIGGTLSEVNIDEGDKVDKDTLIAAIDPPN